MKATTRTSSQKKPNHKPLSQSADRWHCGSHRRDGATVHNPTWWLRLGKKAGTPPDRYHKGKTIQLLAAFAPHTGKAIGLPSPNKTGEVILAFLQDLVVPHFGNDWKVYLVWDNFSAHKLARRLWQESGVAAQHPVPLDFYERLMAESH